MIGVLLLQAAPGTLSVHVSNLNLAAVKRPSFVRRGTSTFSVGSESGSLVHPSPLAIRNPQGKICRVMGLVQHVLTFWV